MVDEKPGVPFPAATLLEPIISVFGAMVDWAAANRHHFEQPGVGRATHSPPGGQQEPLATDFLVPVSQAMLIAANRSVSYWVGLARIFADHRMTFAQVVGTAAIGGSAVESEQLVVADKLRALLREVGDLATREARILQNELGALDDSLAQSLQHPELSGSYHRRWRAKV